MDGTKYIRPPRMAPNRSTLATLADLKKESSPDGSVVEVLLQEKNASSQIAIVVLVRDAPPQRTKFPSFLDLQRNQQ